MKMVVYHKSGDRILQTQMAAERAELTARYEKMSQYHFHHADGSVSVVDNVVGAPCGADGNPIPAERHALAWRSFRGS